MFNPMMQTLMQGMRENSNPMSMLRQIMGNNPRMAPVMNMIEGKSPAQLQTICRNLYKERGLDIEQAARQLGLKL